MKRRDFLKTAVAAGVAAVLPGGSAAMLRDTVGYRGAYNGIVGWKVWHTSAILNREWVVRVQEALDANIVAST